MMTIVILGLAPQGALSRAHERMRLNRGHNIHRRPGAQLRVVARNLEGSCYSNVSNCYNIEDPCSLSCTAMSVHAVRHIILCSTPGSTASRALPSEQSGQGVSRVLLMAQRVHSMQNAPTCTA